LRWVELVPEMNAARKTSSGGGRPLTPTVDRSSRRGLPTDRLAPRAELLHPLSGRHPGGRRVGPPYGPRAARSDRHRAARWSHADGQPAGSPRNSSRSLRTRL